MQHWRTPDYVYDVKGTKRDALSVSDLGDVSPLLEGDNLDLGELAASRRGRPRF